MCQHSWYCKNRRHYGPKPNTRRARGLHRTDIGKKHCIISDKSLDAIPSAGTELSVEKVRLPRWATLKRWIAIYNHYVGIYDLYRDKDAAIEKVIAKYHVRKETVERAIKACKYILATQAETAE